MSAPGRPPLRCKGWQQEAALRMLENNLHPDVAENPAELVVYGGIGKAARNWPSYHAIVRELQRLGDDETLLVQSGKPGRCSQTHEAAPACCSPTRTWCPTGPTGTSSAGSTPPA